MKILVDENIPRMTVDRLRDLGAAPTRVCQMRLFGISPFSSATDHH